MLRVVVGDGAFDELLDVFGSRRDVRTYPNVLVLFAETTGNCVVDAANLHLVQQEHVLGVKLDVRFAGKVFRHAS